MSAVSQIPLGREVDRDLHRHTIQPIERAIAQVEAPATSVSDFLRLPRLKSGGRLRNSRSGG